VISAAVNEILELSMDAFINNDRGKASDVEPLEQVIDDMKENMRTSHVLRMRNGECSMEMGFVWSDILTNFERVSDHCSNIAGCVIDTAAHNLNLHETLGNFKRNDKNFETKYKMYAEKYSIK
ncbi:MAG TPA: Na/Pi cotransporter, partial [Ruminococcaceae bacterium]|nr:Na/Pi cotransporter [Oscillospiraceae bacterium]